MKNLTIRIAQPRDIGDIIALLRNDILGELREIDDSDPYVKALDQIIGAQNNEFYLVMIDHEIVGCFQLTIIPSLSRGAAKRSQIESVRVKTCYRGAGHWPKYNEMGD